MRLSTYIFGAASTFATANAAIKGFNYGAQFNNDQAKKLVDFEYEFNAAKNLPGTNGWTSARLYTMIQHGTQSTVIEAIQAAINTNTTLLLGMWASAGAGPFNNEITALKAAIAQYGTAFTNLVVGISVGSEDLYRITPTGIENKSGPGAQPQELINYVQQTRAAIRGTPLEGKPVGHVDTWTVYVNASNNAFISTLDFLGMDAYPYFQTTMANSISSAGQLFFDAYKATVGASQGKAVWVTETGWPVSGQTLNQAQPSAANARTYWLNVACKLVADNINFYYYTLQDVQWGNPSPSFGIKPGGDLNQVNPLFDLSCPSSRIRPSSSTVIPSTIQSGRVTVSEKTIRLGARQAPPSVKSFPTATNLLKPVPKPSTVPLELGSEFEVPDTLISFNKSNPLPSMGYAFVAQLSADMSTIFFFDVSPDYVGKTCNVAFFVPPMSHVSDVDPLKIRSPGGICVSIFDSPWPTADLAELGDHHLNPLGCVPQIDHANRYNIAAIPCEAGKRVGFQMDSFGGLAADFLQMTSPPLGLFMIPN